MNHTRHKEMLVQKAPPSYMIVSLDQAADEYGSPPLSLNIPHNQLCSAGTLGHGNFPDDRARISKHLEAFAFQPHSYFLFIKLWRLRHHLTQLRFPLQASLQLATSVCRHRLVTTHRATSPREDVLCTRMVHFQAYLLPLSELTPRHSHGVPVSLFSHSKQSPVIHIN